MYLVMKSFWNVAIRGGSAQPAHSIGFIVSVAPVAAATRTVDVLGGDVRVRAAQRDELAVVHVRAAVDELAHVHGGRYTAVRAGVRQRQRRAAGVSLLALLCASTYRKRPA